MKTEQSEHLVWQWHLMRGSGDVYARRAWATEGTDDVIAAGSYEAVQAAKRLLSGKAAGS